MTDNKINRFHLEEAIERAYKEFMDLDEENRNPLNMFLIARKYTPKNAQHVIDCIADNPVILFLEAKAGHLNFDVLIASIGESIAAGMKQKFTEQAQKEEADSVKSRMLRQQIMGG